MPFHIDYDGPASISTFFRVEERVTENSDEPKPVPDEPKAESSTTATAVPPSLARRAATYFVSSFRGRTLHGKTIHVPKGYTGLVWKNIEGVKKGKGKGKATHDGPSSSAARRFRRNRQNEDEDEDAPTAKSSAPVLTPTAQFSSFVLWHPDTLGREKDDEYVRSLDEWTKLSELIHYVPGDE